MSDGPRWVDLFGIDPDFTPMADETRPDREWRWAAENGWVCREVNACTCGGSGVLSPAHQPGCGLEPLAHVGENAAPLAAEHNAALDAVLALLPAPHPHGGTEALRLSNAIFRAIWENSPPTLEYDDAVKATQAALALLAAAPAPTEAGSE